MILRKKKKCSLCSLFTESTVKFNGKKICFNCLEKLVPENSENLAPRKERFGVYTRTK